MPSFNFRQLISDNNTATFRFGLIVFIGLAIETTVEVYFRKNSSSVEITLRLIANILVAGGVLGEVIFAHRVSKEADEQQRKSDEKIAELNQLASEARERAALLEQLTAFRHVPKDVSKLVEFLSELNTRTPIRAQIDHQIGDAESLCYALEIANIFKSAKIEITGFGSNAHIGTTVLGLHMAGTDLDLEAIHKSFIKNGIEFGIATSPASNRAINNSNLIFFIGPKIPPDLIALIALLKSVSPAYQ